MESGPEIPEEERRDADDQDNEESSQAVPDDEIDVDFVRSSGPGGQNVNKRATKAVLKWNVGASDAYTEEQKAAIRAALGNRLNEEDEIVLAAQDERSQAQNKEAAIRRLQKMVAEALEPRKERKKTKVSKAEKEKRREEKRRRGEMKRLRKDIKTWD